LRSPNTLFHLWPNPPGENPDRTTTTFTIFT
jgi:hypothetical protein